ncbi:MAG: DUF883 C-terminal domain-containing protein [Candidatus Pacearchaeota archaeon]
MPQRKKKIGVVRIVKEKAGDFAELAEEKMGTAKLKTEEYIEENPWKSVAITAGVSALIGAVVALGVNALIEKKQPTTSEKIRNRIRDWL